MGYKSLGFATYSDYLQSDLWLGIRQLVMDRAGGLCECCGRPAQCVHHFLYHIGVVNGKRTDPLVALCMGCHKEGEFTREGNKRKHGKANKQIYSMMLAHNHENAARIGSVMGYKRGHRKQKSRAQIRKESQLRSFSRRTKQEAAIYAERESSFRLYTPIQETG
jgi:hypothetical protein